MAVIVQKSAGLLSALISGNEFYQNVYEGNLFCDNGGASNVGIFRIDTGSATIPWTPTAAGNFLGVVLGAYCGTHTGNMSGDIKVELQEDSGGWVTRLTSQQPLSNWWPANKYTQFNGLIDVRFASTYAITTAPATWRLVVTLVGYSGPAFYMLFSQNGPTQANLFFIPYIDSTVTWTSSDTVVLTDQIEIDQDWVLPDVDITSGTQTGRGDWNRHISIWGCTKNLSTVTNPQLYVPPTLSADIDCESSGSVYFSSRSDGLLIGDSEASPIPASRKFTWTFTGMTATKTPGFITYSSNATYAGRSVFLKAFGTRLGTETAERTAIISIGSNQLVVDGDVTSDWAIGDRLMLAGAQGGVSAPSYDYREVEMRTINGMSFSAGETTITLSSNVTSYYPLETDVPNHVINCERNVVLGGDSAAVSANRSWWRLNGGTIEFVGIETKYLYQLAVGYTVPANYPTAEHADIENVYRGCIATESYTGLLLDTAYGATVEDSHTVADSSPGSSINNFGFYVDDCSYGDITFSGCIFAGKHVNYAFTNVGGRGTRVTDCYICGVTAFRFGDGCVNCEYDNNYIHKCRYVFSMVGTLVNMYTHNNVVRDLHASTAFKTGDVFNLSTGMNIVGWYSEEDDVEKFRQYFIDAFSCFFQIIMDGCLATDYSGSLMYSTFRTSWISGSYIGFNRHDQVTGQVFRWEPDGYIESTGNGLTDTEAHTTGAGKLAWRHEPEATDVEHKMTWHVPVDGSHINKPVTVSVWVKLASTNYAAGVYVAPTLRMTGLGVTGATVTTALVNTTDWQLIVVTGTPTRRGLLTMSFEIETDATSPDSQVYWDDVLVSYSVPPQFGGLDVAFNAFFVDPPLDIQLTSGQVWAELLSANQVPGSFGEYIQSLIQTAVRDEILSDSTPFDGADIDTAISSRSSHSAADVQALILSDATPFDGADIDAAVSSRSSHAAADVQALVLSDATPFDGADIDAAVSTRSSHGAADVQALVLSDATPFDGADIDAAISSRSGHSAADVDTQLSGTHGSGSWEGDTADTIADAVWDEAKAGHVAAGSFGEALNDLGLKINAAISESGTDLLAHVWWSRNDRVVTGFFSSVSAIVKDSAGSQVLDLGAATETGGRFAWTGSIASITVGQGFSLEVTADTIVYAVAFARN